MKRKNLFWSYSGQPNDSILIEHTLKYDDVDSIKLLIDKFGEKDCLAVWEKTLVPDIRFRKLNFFLAKFIFRIAENDLEVIKLLNKYSGNTRGKYLYDLSNR